MPLPAGGAERLADGLPIEAEVGEVGAVGDDAIHGAVHGIGLNLPQGGPGGISTLYFKVLDRVNLTALYVTSWCPRAPQPADPRLPALHARAMADLRFIRETMENASSFSTFSGLGLALIGGIAGRPAASSRARSPRGRAGSACGSRRPPSRRSSGALSTAWKTRALEQPLIPGPSRKFALSLAPTLFAGTLLTSRRGSGRAVRSPARGVAPAVRSGTRRGRRMVGPDRAGDRSVLHGAGHRGLAAAGRLGQLALDRGLRRAAPGLRHHRREDSMAADSNAARRQRSERPAPPAEVSAAGRPAGRVPRSGIARQPRSTTASGSAS